MEATAVEGGLSLLSVSSIILVLWFVMTKKTKESLGNAIQHTAGYSSDFMVIQRERQTVSALVEIDELLKDSNKTVDEVNEFKTRLGLGK